MTRVGGKNASLGELIRALDPAAVEIPPGFATTAKAYWAFLAANDLREPIEATLAKLAPVNARPRDLRKRAPLRSVSVDADAAPGWAAGRIRNSA